MRTFAEMEMTGKPMDYYRQYRANISAVTGDRVQEVANRFVDPERMVILIVGDREPCWLLGLSAQPRTPSPCSPSSHHDLLEGRDTASRGYHVAAEYAASLLALWGIKPGGDKPGMGPMTAAAFFGEQTSRRPPEQSYLQEFAMMESLDSTTEISLDLKLGALSKSRTFQSGVDFTGMLTTPGSFTAPVVSPATGSPKKRSPTMISRTSTSRARSS
jgi:hypothetical protein